MVLTIEATFENGVFVPKERPSLAEHERVRLVVESLPTKNADRPDPFRDHKRIQIDPQLAQEIASDPESGVSGKA